jgi:hypothetical protein
MRQISSTPYRHFSVFSTWKNDWHNPSFFSDDDTVKEKENWLESMLRSHENDVDMEAFLIVFKALVSSNDPGASRRAGRWMSRLKQHPNAQPSAECYQLVIQAWANSTKEQAAVIVNRAERWLNDCIDESESSLTLETNIECYNAFLDACTKGRGGKDKRKEYIVQNHARRAEDVLRHLQSYQYSGEKARIIPNTCTFNYVIRGWTRCKNDDSVARRVMALLRMMESYQREDPLFSAVRPNTKSYTMSMDAYVSVAKIKARRSSVSKNFNPDPSENGLKEIREARAILEYMHDLYDAGVEGVVPSRVPYNTLITGWAALAGFMHPNAPFEAEKVLRKMISLKDGGFAEGGPDSLSYEKVGTVCLRVTWSLI